MAVGGVEGEGPLTQAMRTDCWTPVCKPLRKPRRAKNAVSRRDPCYRFSASISTTPRPALHRAARATLRPAVFAISWLAPAPQRSRVPRFARRVSSAATCSSARESRTAKTSAIERRSGRRACAQRVIRPRPRQWHFPPNGCGAPPGRRLREALALTRSRSALRPVALLRSLASSNPGDGSPDAPWEPQTFPTRDSP